LKFEEIAELLEIPLGTALSRMNAALRRLRKDLDYAHASGEL
jgi:DNA-directed RNA polymerase specialized sigma24 family protein